MHRDKRLKTDAVIDSGATQSLFDIQIAEQLGIDLKKGLPILIHGIYGVPQTAYFHQIHLQIGTYRFEAAVGFAPLHDQACGILGQHGFFEFFKVAFDYLDRSFDVTPYSFVRRE